MLAQCMLFIALALLVAAAAAAPPSGNDRKVVSYGYETSNGIVANSEGQVNNRRIENEAIEVHGGYSYVDPDGVTHPVTYNANENGFETQDTHLPIAPN